MGTFNGVELRIFFCASFFGACFLLKIKWILRQEECVLCKKELISRNDSSPASAERSPSFHIQQQFPLQPEYVSYREAKLYVS